MLNIYWMIILFIMIGFGICFLDESGKCKRLTRFVDKLMRRLAGR